MTDATLKPKYGVDGKTISQFLSIIQTRRSSIQKTKAMASKIMWTFKDKNFENSGPVNFNSIKETQTVYFALDNKPVHNVYVSTDMKIILQNNTVILIPPEIYVKLTGFGTTMMEFKTIEAAANFHATLLELQLSNLPTTQEPTKLDAPRPSPAGSEEEGIADDGNQDITTNLLKDVSMVLEPPAQRSREESGCELSISLTVS